MFNAVASPIYFTLYSYIFVLNFGSKFLTPSIFNSKRPFPVFCSFSNSSTGATSVSDSFLMIFIVYVLTVFPSSAVTCTFTIFSPELKVTFPVPEIFALESCA